MHFTAIAATLLTCASLATALPSGKSLEKRCTEHEILKALAGTYRLVNTTSALNGNPIPDEAYGKAPVGLLMYSAEGWMSATITATEPEFRPNLTFPYQPNDTDADWAAVGRHSIGYAGPLRLSDAIPANKTNGQVFHGPLVVANVPTWVGQNQRRNYTVIEDGDESYLKIGSERGGGYTGTLWWKKIKTTE
ncbi:Lipocalin-like domain-containing protein [Coprinopsis sp. MPI-PUGE-AT-0042]|nr:Lipocalin-like domain-containing protein [Coprinopsis sp. MPI-PUGE-AT-0042]